MYILHSVYHIYDVNNIETLGNNKRDYIQSFAFDMSERKSLRGWFWQLYEAQLWASETLINETPGVNKPGPSVCFFNLLYTSRLWHEGKHEAVEEDLDAGK